MKQIEKLTEKVTKIIKLEILEIFAIVFDGWERGDTYYVGLFATYSTDNCLGYEKVFLLCGLMFKEDCLDANEHFK